MGILNRTIMTELDNGVRLCYFHRRGSSVEFQFHVLTGSIHEGEYLGCGLSHFLEHMAFQGCAGFPERSVCDIVNQLGGDVNAYTSYDRTCYTMQLPREYWRNGIDMLCAMVRFPECPEARFEAEKQVILRECERGNDDPGQKLFKQFLKTMFISNPMRFPIIGFPEMISQVTRDMMMNYHQKRYTPERCVLVVAGELSAAALFDAVNDRVGDWRRASLAEPVLPDDPLPLSTRKSEVIFQDSSERIFWGVRGPWFGSAETSAVDLLFNVLGTGDNSLLNSSLVLDKQLALRVNSFCYSLCGSTFAGISGKTEPAKMGRFQSALLKELEKVAGGKISAAAVEREKGQLYADHLRNFRELSNIAGEIAGGVIYDNSPEAGDIYLENLQRTGIVQIREAAARYLDLTHWVCVHQHCRKKSAVKKTEEKSIPLKSFTVPSGNQVLFAPDDQLPLCSFFMVMPGGAVFENNGSYGVSRILAAALTAGGGRYSEKQFLQKLDEAGVELEISAGANTLLLNFTAPKRKMNQAVAVIAEVLSAPRLPEDAVCREIIRCQEQIKERQFVPVKKAYDQALLAMYGEHPYAYGKCGKAEDIAMLNRGKLLDFYRSYCAGKRVLGFGGDCTEADVEKWSMMIDGALPAGGNILTVPEFSGFSKDVQRKCFSLSREQTVVLRMLPGPERADSDELDIFDILYQAENGLASELFKEVREKHALSYSVGMSFSAGFHPGSVSFYAMTAAGAEEQVMDLLNAEIRRLAERGLNKDEFEAARSSVLFDLKRTMDSADMLVRTAAMDLYYGKTPEDFTGRVGRLETLGLLECNSVLKKYFTAPVGAEVMIVPEN